MKVAFVVHDYRRDFGHGRYVVELAERFCASHEVHVLANTFMPDPHRAIRLHRVPALRFTAFTTILSFLIPATLLLQKDFDIIHVQGLSAFRFNVITAHVCSSAYLDSQASSAQSGKWKRSLFEKFVAPLEKRVFSNSKGSWAIAVSRKIQTELAEHYGRTSRSSVIYHGVDAVRFSPDNKDQYRELMRKQLDLSENDIAFLYVGDLRKGARTAIRAIREVPDTKLILVSRTPYQEYERQVKDLGLNGRVLFCPPVVSLEQHYSAADGFLYPSHYDSFGMVIFEAMASGLPVVVSRRCGASELITHRKDGILLENPFDENEASQCVRLLANDAELRNTLGDAARKMVRNYSWDRVAEETMNVYLKVLSERN